MNKAELTMKVEEIDTILKMGEEEYKEHFENKFKENLGEGSWWAHRTGEVSALVTLMRIELKTIGITE